MKSENKIQQQIVFWFRNTYCTKLSSPRYSIFSVPNESQNAKEQMYKKSIGLLSGVSDLIVVLDSKVLFIECKDEKGKQSDTQLDFESVVTNLNHSYHVVRGLEEFQSIIKKYLETCVHDWYGLDQCHSKCRKCGIISD